MVNDRSYSKGLGLFLLIIAIMIVYTFLVTYSYDK